MNGIELIAQERQRQIEKEGWTPQHDDGHDNGEIARAAAVYALPPNLREVDAQKHVEWSENGGRDLVWWTPRFWPSSWRNDYKPCPEDRIRELTKAGALIAAEIDRLQRSKQEQPA